MEIYNVKLEATEMTQAQQLLIAALESIDASKGSDGICRQVRAYIAPKGYYDAVAMEAIEIMEKLMLLWPEASDDKLYPVPNPRRLLESSPYRTFCYHCDRGTLWVGKYGEKRKELVAWMLEQLRK